MARALAAGNRAFTVHYLVRSRALAAFGPGLEALGLGDRYRLHCDDVDGRVDVRALVANAADDAHFYVCGPEAVLDAVREACRELGRGTVSFERFAATSAVRQGPEESFQVVLDSTGEHLEVPADKSILQVLREAGRDVAYSCSEGVCGSCITDVLQGDIDHRDSILTEDEQLAGDCMCICVSRARGRLVLDL
jgi:ferredoxin